MTGGSGRIGGYLLRELLRHGHATSSFGRTAPLVEGVTFVPGDINSLHQLKEACLGHDTIVHLSAVAGPGRVGPEQLMYVNVMGTVNVLEAAVQSGVSKVVFASSGAATGFSFQNREIIPCYLPIDEEHPCEPQDEYGLSKLLGELTCKRYSDAYALQTICLRINHSWYLDRAGAEVAVRSRWARQTTVEELWKQSYRKTIEVPEDDWFGGPPRGPRRLLWAVTDARDSAQAARLAVENNDIVHETFLINGDDTCSTSKTPTLISRYYPDVPLKAPLEGYASLFSHDKATRMLGYRPQHTWRESEFGAWLADQQYQQ